MCRIIRGEDPLCGHVGTVTQRSESCGSLQPAGLKMTDSCRINRRPRGRNGPPDWPYANLPRGSKPLLTHCMREWLSCQWISVMLSELCSKLLIAKLSEVWEKKSFFFLVCRVMVSYWSSNSNLLWQWWHIKSFRKNKLVIYHPK